jgi:DNA adenine methylase
MKGPRIFKNKDDALKSKESYYYYLRNIFNGTNDDLKRSALFLFLNKTCFRGLYREGPNGFNVPFGHYKNSSFLSLEDYLKISGLIQNVCFKHMDFADSIKLVNDGDFCYLDPPYYPESDKSFTKYNKNDFTLENHNQLFELTKDLDKRNIKFLFSNSNTSYVKDNFENYSIILVQVRRAINSKNPESKTHEVLIHN